MIDWNLQDRRILQPLRECAVVCDPGQASLVMTFSHSGLEAQSTTFVTVVSYLANASWLMAMLRTPTLQQCDSRASLGGRSSLELVLVCNRSPTPEERAAVAEADFRLSIWMTWSDPDGTKRELPLEILRLRLQTREQEAPTISFHRAEHFELSRREVLKELDVGLCEMTVTQPAGALEYAAGNAKIDVKAIVQPLTGSAAEPQAWMRRGELSWPAHLSRTDALLAGETLTYSCAVAADDLVEAAGNDSSLLVQIDWTVEVSLPGKESQRTEKRMEVRLHLVQHEVLAIEIKNALVVPPMHAGDPETVPVRGFSVPANMLMPGNQEHIPFAIRRLGTAWETVKVQAAIQQVDQDEWSDLSWYTILPDTPLTNDRIRVQVRLGVLIEKSGILGGSKELRLVVRLIAARGGESVSGQVESLISVRERDAAYLACLDFGTSAIAVWFGESKPKADPKLIPLGEFVNSIAGAHSEYDPDAPGENRLAPSAISLASASHLRSHRDPLSLGDLSLAGADTKAVRHRLSALRRKYDVSLPAMPDLDAADIIPDLKRRLLNSKYRTARSVAELNGDSLRDTIRLDLPAVMSDVFRELGSYVMPNAMQLDHAVRPSSRDDVTPYEQWLECDPGDIQVVVTHPSGVSGEQREIYRDAARAFAGEFVGGAVGIREPKLIPEALAAAYYGITRSRTAPAGAEVFACIDIGASTVDASLVQANREPHGAIKSWEVLAHFGATVGGANLDEALLELCLKSVRRLFPKGGTGYEDLILDPRHRDDDDSIRRLLALAIQRAKRELSDKLMGPRGSRGPYGWARSGPGSTFRVGLLKGIVSPREPGQPLQKRSDPIEHVHGRALLRVDEVDGGGQEVCLEILPALLNGERTIDDPNRDDPRAVARLLGYAIPALLIREAQRLGVAMPEWVLTGRASLWPSIYEGIARSAYDMGDKRSLPRPFGAADMKNAIVHGARSLAISDLALTDGAKHPYALVQYEESDEEIADIEYLGTEGRSNSNRRVSYRANCWLSRVLPGLSERGAPDTIARKEIVQLFRAFGQRVTVDECLVKRSGVTPGGDEDVEISWEQRGELMLFKVGDIFVSVQPNRLAGI